MVSIKFCEFLSYSCFKRSMAESPVSNIIRFLLCFLSLVSDSSRALKKFEVLLEDGDLYMFTITTVLLVLLQERIFTARNSVYVLGS